MQQCSLSLLLFAAVSASAATPRACDLVTPQQVSPVFAGKSFPGLEHDTGPQHTCSFSDPNQTRNFVLNVEATQVFGGPAVLRQMMLMPARQGETREPLPGVGDFATYSTDEIGNGSITLLYRGYLVTLEVTDRVAVPGMKPPLLLLAKQAISKL